MKRETPSKRPCPTLKVDGWMKMILALSGLGKRRINTKKKRENRITTYQLIADLS